MANIWFYTLSTLAQVMAAFVALFGIFVVFSLDKLQGEINAIRKQCIEAFNVITNHGNEENRKFCCKYKLSKESGAYPRFSDSNILEITSEAFKNRSNLTGGAWQQGNVHTGKETLETFSYLLEKKRLVLHSLRKSLVFGIAPIIISLVLLASPLSTSNTYWGYILFLLVVFSCLSMGHIAYSIYKVNRE